MVAQHLRAVIALMRVASGGDEGETSPRMTFAGFLSVNAAKPEAQDHEWVQFRGMT